MIAGRWQSCALEPAVAAHLGQGGGLPLESGLTLTLTRRGGGLVGREWAGARACMQRGVAQT